MEAALLTGMLLAFFVVSLVLLSQKGLFIDDSMHMPAGYSYLLTHDYRLNQEHPPLIKLLSGLGLWELHPYFPFESPGWQQAATPGDPEDGMVRIEEAFFESNAKQFERIAFYGRLPVLVIPLLLLLAAWWFTRQLFGPVPALISVFLLAMEPNIAGNAIVVQNDVAAALALLLFVIAVKKFVTDARVIGALALGGALGLGLVTKYSLVVLVPVSCVIVIAYVMWRLIRKRSSVGAVVLSSFVVFVTAYLILIAFYTFHLDRIDANESSEIASWFYLSGHTAEVFKRFLMWLPPLLPRYFVSGIDMVVQDSRDGRPAFLLGQISDTGWWYYFPVAFALKTTIPFLLASIGGFVWAVYQVLRRKCYAILYVVLPGVFYLALTMTSHLNIGVRHLLPMFPFAAIAGAGFVSAVIECGLKRSRGLGVAVAAVALVPCLVIAVSAFPNYLTYFSPLACGAARGWQMLSDSNVETGQEVKPLARYLKDHGENRVTGIMVGGEFLKFYGIQADDFPGWYDDEDSEDAAEPIKTEYIAIGAWNLSEIDLSDKQKEIIDRYRQQKPEMMVGDSIFVFRRQH
ncbi:MAG TPA: glycosyltransferase family 39 protein [Pyrinomonadaceae bacterium]|nr:glycosyltransferase family 39 protein [Pyrinomonadaceae bacterium]